MFDLEPIFEFSRHHCVAICSFLVPSNLIATFLTLTLVATEKPRTLVSLPVATGSIAALTLFLHVSTWFIIGVITPVTFILLGLGATCLLANLLALIYSQELSNLFTFAKGYWVSKFN